MKQVYAFMLLFPSYCLGFSSPPPSFVGQQRHVKTSTTELNAIGVLARKAKEAEIRKYCQAGLPDDVQEKYNQIKEFKNQQNQDEENKEEEVVDLAPLQEALTRRKGTITVVAEYKRKHPNGESIQDDRFDIELLSPAFRDQGASAIAVLADERMGGCTYKDLADFAEEQRRARYEVPGPLSIINADLIVDEVQLARSAAMGLSAVVINYSVVGNEERVGELLTIAQRALNLEVIVAVENKEQAQKAVDLGAKILLVTDDKAPKGDDMTGAQKRFDCIDGLNIPEGRKLCTIATIPPRTDNSLREIEEAWQCRDLGFNSVWVSDVLYKSGNDVTEHPGAIIKSMRAKSSVRWAEPNANTKGEGAREYLGDILM